MIKGVGCLRNIQSFQVLLPLPGKPHLSLAKRLHGKYGDHEGISLTLEHFDVVILKGKRKHAINFKEFLLSHKLENIKNYKCMMIR